MEHDEQGERLESELKRMDEHSDEIGERIDETRREWEAKEDDPAVPGAQPDPGEEESVASVAADEETLSEEGGP